MSLIDSTTQTFRNLFGRLAGLRNLLKRRTGNGVGEAAEWLADVIKDAVLDWTPDEAGDDPDTKPLPPLKPEEFVAALRGRAEEVLTALAASINQAPDARTVLAGPEECLELLGEFLDEALRLAVQMRVDAAVAALPAPPAPRPRWRKSRAAQPTLQGPTRNWVTKFRRMKADGGNLPG
jgi:hypothetical protein